MGLQFYRRIPIDRRSHLNVSGSGVSATTRVTKNITVNSRGRVSIRLGKGIWWRFGR